MYTTNVYRGINTIKHDDYHGVQSIYENGALKHAYQIARILLKEGKAQSETEALLIATVEVQRLIWEKERIQLHQRAREELKTQNNKLRILLSAIKNLTYYWILS